MISGIQKMSLLDFPGKVACTVFLGGCNLRCPFCHNSELFDGTQEEIMTIDEFLSFLKTRKGLLDAVCVSGGEPTLHKDLPELFKGIKDLGFATKLDTNGTNPEMLKKLVSENLLDYVAMDVKNSPSRYAQTVGIDKIDITPFEESIKYLIEGNVDYELRTTLVNELHDEASILEMGEWLGTLVPGKKVKKLYLQSFVDRDTVVFSGLSAPSEKTLETFENTLKPYIEEVVVRSK